MSGQRIEAETPYNCQTSGSGRPWADGFDCPHVVGVVQLLRLQLCFAIGDLHD